MAYATADVGRMGRIVWGQIMEEAKRLFKKCGLPILLLLIFVMAGVIGWERQPVRADGADKP